MYSNHGSNVAFVKELFHSNQVKSLLLLLSHAWIAEV